ncbi:uncharacterized protein LOC125814815 [Solanum verrucosum]|uniref:uncharacterized protein LOC125814815 n=1 Tax=Solanum verrucosum TaxID=315347 RepID=UPI0020D09D65|nr:uncharacterized protein LOC125814815 [Solanum verrucosum]
MNFNLGDCSNNNDEDFSSSSSSSLDLDFFPSTEHHDNLINQLRMNNYMFQQVLQYHTNEVFIGVSIPGHVVINRDRETVDDNLFRDYFSATPHFNDAIFRRRYRMSRNLFLRIVDAIKDHDTYFEQRIDALGRFGLSTLQKITAVFRMLAYEVFGEQYLRSPTPNDVGRLLHIGEQRGFPGMLGSLDSMHWKWKNCPTAWAGQYAGRSGSPTIILEVVADYDLWIWHAYFGLPSTNNNINVLESSHLFFNLASGIAPPAHYVIQGKEYNMGY